MLFPVWHLCVIVHVFGYMSGIHIPVWTNGFWKLGVSPPPVHMYAMVPMTCLCLGVSCTFAFLSVMLLSHVAACLCSSRLAKWVCHESGYTATFLPVCGPWLCA